MANVNLQTKKIYGCKKGTKTYYHEQAHLLFEDKARGGNLIRQLQDGSIIGLLFLVALNSLYANFYLKFLIFFSMIISIVSELEEEIWCWNYANLKLRKKEDDARFKTR